VLVLPTHVQQHVPVQLQQLGIVRIEGERPLEHPFGLRRVPGEIQQRRRVDQHLPVVRPVFEHFVVGGFCFPDSEIHHRSIRLHAHPVFYAQTPAQGPGFVRVALRLREIVVPGCRVVGARQLEVREGEGRIDFHGAPELTDDFVAPALLRSEHRRHEVTIRFRRIGGEPADGNL
jgi:hypothetical protein